MLNRIFVVDSVTLSSTGTAVSSYVPWDQTTRKLPTQVVVKATGQGAYVRLSNDNSAATNVDVLVQGGDHVVLSVQGRRWVSVLSDGASSTVSVGALSTGVSGDAASLSLDFAGTGTLDSRITFTRASTATYFNSAGVLTSAATNAPRFDYNPSTLAAQGLLIEEARTNALSYSEDFGNAAWTKSGSTVSTDTTTAPTGTVVADSLTEDTSTGTHRCFRSTTGTTNTNAYTFSAFIKANTRSRVYMAIVEGATFSRQGNANFDLSAGNVISFSTGINGATGGSATITPVGNGWYRCTYTVTLGGTDTSILTDFQLIDTGTNRNYTGDGTSGLFLFGAQLEAGAFPTSYIPTTTTALTRAADVASVNTLSPWFNASAGTIYADFAGRVSGTQPYITMLSNTGETERIYQRYVSGQYQSIARVAGVDIASVYNSTEGSAVNAKIATAYDSSQLATSTNGQAVTGLAVASLSSIPSGLNKFWLGSFAGSGSFANGYLRRITYYPRRLSNAELVSITS
jgi:hypothetical protein